MEFYGSRIHNQICLERSVSELGVPKIPSSQGSNLELPLQSAPLPVTSRVITPLMGLIITPVSHLL